MSLAPFEYVVAKDLDQAVKLLRQHGDEAKLLSGGHSLIPAMKLGLATPAVLIDIGRIAGLAGIKEDKDAVVIGGATVHHTLETSSVLAEYWPVVTDAAAVIGDPQIRNRGTIGGSLVHADPAADLPAVALALEAEFQIHGPDGVHTVPAGEFFIAIFTTVLGPAEILSAIRIPLPAPRTGSAYLKLARKASDFAIAGAAAVVTLDESGKFADVRLGMAGVADVPYRAAAVEEQLTGRKPDADTIAAAAQHVTDGVTVAEDLNASADYRRHVAAVYARRALTRAVERARGTS